MRFFKVTAGLVLGLISTSYALKVTILADTNRDGKVDVTGNSDAINKTNWTEDFGALFLANIGDVGQRCSSKITEKTAWQDLDKCHDASDNTQRNPKYLAPLRTLPIVTLSNSAIGNISVSGKQAAVKVRIFHKQGDKWLYALDNYVFSAKDLRAGLELGIDARDVRRPNDWDGNVMVHFHVQDCRARASDSVALRVAPLLTHHHLQVAQKALTVRNTEFHADPQKPFTETFQNAVHKANITEPVHMFGITTDIWAQDFFEPGYTSIPGPKGPVVLRIMIRSSQPVRLSGRQIFTELRSETVGAVQWFAQGNSTDSMGNLETVPPHTHNGRTYGAGRIVMGAQNGEEPKVLEFLRAQEEQKPIVLDTSWLAIGHTDEFLQFLRADNARGWVLMVADPNAGLALLEKARAKGNGQVKAVSRKRMVTDQEPCLPDQTIEEVLNTPNMATVTEYCTSYIKKNIDILKREVGITDDEIFYVPGIFFDDAFDCKEGGPPRRAAAKGMEPGQGPLSILEAVAPGQSLQLRRESARIETAAYYPGAVNGVVLSNMDVLVPMQWGPVIDGKDIFRTAVDEAYAKVNYTVSYIDDWYSHHMQAGEVHCGTNILRDPSAPWW